MLGMKTSGSRGQAEIGQIGKGVLRGRPCALSPRLPYRGAIRFIPARE
jgi:hypothetical protein